MRNTEIATGSPLIRRSGRLSDAASALSRAEPETGSRSHVPQNAPTGADVPEPAAVRAGTTEQATDEELRKAFDYMSNHFNPERMSIMGDDLERMARMKYVRILEARDRIWLARGMVMSAERLLE